MISFDKSDPRYSIELQNYREVINRVLDTLTEREKRAIELYDFEDHTYKSAAQILHITPNRFGLLRGKAFRKLCHHTRKEILEAEYYGIPLNEIREKRIALEKLENETLEREFEKARAEEEKIKNEIYHLLERIKNQGDDFDEPPPSYLSVVSNSLGLPRLMASYGIMFTLPPHIYTKWVNLLST